MAVDTRLKRASVLGIATAITLTLPLADGTLEQGDRQHVAFCYSGLAASDSAAIDATADVVIRCQPDAGVIQIRPDAGVIQIRPDVGELDL